MKNQSKVKEKTQTTNKKKPQIQKLAILLSPFALGSLIYLIVNVENVVAVVLPHAPLVPQERVKADISWLNGENPTYFVYFIACFYRNRRAFIYTNVP